jgi:hypothetical protein
VIQTHGNDFIADHIERLIWFYVMKCQAGDPTGGKSFGFIDKGIGEDVADQGFHIGLAVNRHRLTAKSTGEEAGIVEPEEVVGVSVRVNDGVNRARPLSEDLQTHLGRGVDQNISARSSQQDAWPGALIARVKREADFALAANHGNARGRPTAEENQFEFRSGLDQVGHGEAVTNSILLSNLRDG